MQIKKIGKAESTRAISFLSNKFLGRSEDFWYRSLDFIFERNGGCAGYFFEESGDIKIIVLVIDGVDQDISISSLASEIDQSYLVFPFLRQVFFEYQGRSIYNYSAVPEVKRLMTLLGFESLSETAYFVPPLGNIFKVKQVEVDSGLLTKGMAKQKHRILAVEHNELGTVLIKKCSMIRKSGRLRRLGFILTDLSSANDNQLGDIACRLILKGIVLISPTKSGAEFAVPMKRFPISLRTVDPSKTPHCSWMASEFAIMDF